MIKKLFLVVFAALLHFSAFPQTMQYQGFITYNGQYFESAWASSANAAGSQVVALLNAAEDKEVCPMNGEIGEGNTWSDWQNGSFTGGQYVGIRIYNETTGIVGGCNPPVTMDIDYAIEIRAQIVSCEAGQKSTETYFSGWNTSSGGDLDTQIPGSDNSGLPGSACKGGCYVSTTDVIGCYTQVEPSSNGYFRMSCTYEFETNGESCSPDTVPDNNGPVPPVPPPYPSNNSGDSGDPTGNDGNPSNNPEDPTGEGSNGGSTKDPDACSAAQIANGTCVGSGGSSSGGSGGTPTPDDPAQCGGVGQPLCRVQVNESGTTDGSAQLETMKGHGDKVTDLVKEDGTFWTKVKTYLQKTSDEIAGWTWSFALPSGCSPFHLSGYNITIDMCAFQPVIHDLMSLFWVLATLAGLVGLFIRGID